MKVLEENKNFLDLVHQKGEDLKSEDLENLFPTISDKIKELIEKDEEAKKEMMAWVQKEVQGSQFNAIRYCCVPDDDTSDNKKTFSNDFCESYKICPFYRQNAAPEGDLCPLETLQVQKLTEELVKELEIDIMEDYTDKILVGELIMYSLIETRAIRGLACLNLGFSNVSQGKNGKEYTRQKNFYLDVIKDMQLIKDKLRKSLVSTREEKIRLKQTKSIDKAKDVYTDTLEKIKNSSSEIGIIIDVDDDKQE